MIQNDYNIEFRMTTTTLASKLCDIAVDEVAPGYNLANYLGFSLLIKMENGYVNATHLCKQSEKKREFFNWNRLDVAKETIEDLAAALHRRRADLIEVVNSGNTDVKIRGTYVHPHLVPVIAQWCSPKFRNRVAVILEDMAVREYKYKLAEANKEVMDLKQMMTKLEKQNDEMKQQNAEQTRQIQELLGYAKDTKSTLDKTNTKLDIIVDATVQAMDDLDIIHNKVDEVMDTVAENLVVPPTQPSKSTSFVLVQLDSRTFKCIRRQKQTVNTTVARLKHEYPNAKVVEEFSYANSVNFLVRLKEYLRKHPNFQIKARYQNITGELEDVRCVIYKLLEEQHQIDALEDIKTVTHQVLDRLDKAV